MQRISLRAKVIFLVMIGVSFQSCIHHKELVTLNGGDRETNDKRDVKSVIYNELREYQPYKIQPFDQLMIKINAFDGNTEEFLNREFSAENTFSREISYDPASLYFNSYTVDETGNIVLPLIGKIKVQAKTLSKVKQELDEQYEPHLKFVATTVKLANMRVTVFGEVNNPGVHYLNNERNTLLDIISMAGDITDFGNREKVKLIRLTKRGTETVYLNLNKSGFIATEFYYVQPYDMIYIEPTKSKARDKSTNIVGVVISAISAGILLLNLFTRR